jgi:hypothetical protein
MRILTALITPAVLFASLTPLAFGQASQSSAGMLEAPLPACSGVYSIIRLVELKPGVTVDQYMTALKAHQAWYKKHGYDDVIYAAQVIERDSASGKAVYSSHSILTRHYFAPTSPHPKKDAEWDAFVKMYTDVSDLKETYFTCTPMAHAPRSMKLGSGTMK